MNCDNYASFHVEPICQFPSWHVSQRKFIWQQQKLLMCIPAAMKNMIAADVVLICDCIDMLRRNLCHANVDVLMVMMRIAV